MLGAFAGDAIVLADRQRQLTVARPTFGLQVLVERIEVLNGALAERLLTDDDAAGIVLDGRGEDLGCRGAEAVDEHRKRSVIGDPRHRIRVVEPTDAATRIP